MENRPVNHVGPWKCMYTCGVLSVTGDPLYKQSFLHTSFLVAHSSLWGETLPVCSLGQASQPPCWLPFCHSASPPPTVAPRKGTGLREASMAWGHLLASFFPSPGSGLSFSGLHCLCHHKLRCSEHFCCVLRTMFQKELREKYNRFIYPPGANTKYCSSVLHSFFIVLLITSSLT